MPRIRELGLSPGHLEPGPLNAITDVPGVRVGHATVRRDVDGVPWRSGVTAIWPHDGEPWRERVYAGTSVLNGYGEMTAAAVVAEWGLLDTPILLTGTTHLGAVYHETMQWLLARGATSAAAGPPIPLVAECDDSWLDGSGGLAIGRAEVWAALDEARGGPVSEGCVGAGTGMALFRFKGGVGTASRRVPFGAATWTVGALVLTNYGHRHELLVGGRPVGRALLDPPLPAPPPAEGSCIVVLATDAPLSARQCTRLATRAGLGLARTGATAHDGSGDLFLAFATANRVPWTGPDGAPEVAVRVLLEGRGGGASPLTALFGAAVEATEEAVLNALVAAETTTGREGRVLEAVQLERLRALLL